MNSTTLREGPIHDGDGGKEEEEDDEEDEGNTLRFVFSFFIFVLVLLLIAWRGNIKEHERRTWKQREVVFYNL